MSLGTMFRLSYQYWPFGHFTRRYLAPLAQHLLESKAVFSTSLTGGQLGLDTGAASAFCTSLVANLRLRWVTWKIEHCGLVLFGGVSPNDKAGS